jgi:hypothetical protein
MHYVCNSRESESSHTFGLEYLIKNFSISLYSKHCMSFSANNDEVGAPIARQAVFL